MVLFTILLLILILLTIITVFCISVGGTIFVILFSDVIVCIVIIGWILKCLMKK